MVSGLRCLLNNAESNRNDMEKKIDAGRIDKIMALVVTSLTGNGEQRQAESF